MASSSYFLFAITAISILISSSNAANPRSFLIPAFKDTVKTQYYINAQLGTPPANFSTSIDLSGQNLFINCNTYDTFSFSDVPCASAECSAIGSGHCSGCMLPKEKLCPHCCNTNTADICGTYANNPLGALVSSGIMRDAMLLPAASPSPVKFPFPFPGFLFSCSPPTYMNGLSAAVKGVVGLGSGPIGSTAQLASAFKIDRTVSICLPSSVKAAGAVVFGSLASSIKPVISLTRTPLVPYPIENVLPREEYYIGVRSVRISGKAVVLNSSLLSFDNDGTAGGTKLSTFHPWTVLHPELYRPVVVGFVTKALAMKLKRVTGVRPFGACFSIGSAGKKTATGPAVPTIELDLKSGGQWKIYGANSMVIVNNEVMCLGFVKSSSTFGPAILIGAHQLEDNLLEFDQRAKTLRFSSSLLSQGFSCSTLPRV